MFFLLVPAWGKPNQLQTSKGGPRPRPSVFELRGHLNEGQLEGGANTGNAAFVDEDVVGRSSFGPQPAIRNASALPTIPHGLHRCLRDPADVVAFPTGAHYCATTAVTAVVVHHGERSVVGSTTGVVRHQGCVFARRQRRWLTVGIHGEHPWGWIRTVDRLQGCVCACRKK